MLRFLRTNKGLWRIVWYELNAAHQGIHPELDENGDWKLSSLYGDNLPPQEEMRLLRYYEILWEEICILAGVLQEGQNSGFLKKTIVPGKKDSKTTSTATLSTESIFGACHLFAGIANSVFHVIDSEMEDEELAAIIVDYFLNGHAVKK